MLVTLKKSNYLYILFDEGKRKIIGFFKSMAGNGGFKVFLEMVRNPEKFSFETKTTKILEPKHCLRKASGIKPRPAHTRFKKSEFLESHPPQTRSVLSSSGYYAH